MKYLATTLILLLSTPTLFAQNKCFDLFLSAKTEALGISEDQILNKLETLVKSSIDIQLNNFENPAQLQQAKEFLDKELKSIININLKYLDVFKTMRDQKADQLITTTNNKKLKDREEKREKEKKAKEDLDPIRLAQKLIFHKILPGTFDMLGKFDTQNEKAKKPVLTTITKSYELAQTQTTQLQWAVIQVLLGKKDPNQINPSEYKTGYQTELVYIRDIGVQMKPNHPIEMVSHEDVIEWITGLNELSKDADDQIQKEIQRVIPGHKKGMVYDLPTEAQWAFVMQNRGKNNEIHFDRADDNELSEYAVYGKSISDSNRGTEAVATKKPRLIDRGDGTVVKFYDLEGNVEEWNKDWAAELLAGGNDPQGPASGFSYVKRGGWWGDDSVKLRVDRRSYYNNLRRGYIGFRLARTNP